MKQANKKTREGQSILHWWIWKLVEIVNQKREIIQKKQDQVFVKLRIHLFSASLSLVRIKVSTAFFKFSFSATPLKVSMFRHGHPHLVHPVRGGLTSLYISSKLIRNHLTLAWHAHRHPGLSLNTVAKVFWLRVLLMANTTSYTSSWNI